MKETMYEFNGVHNGKKIIAKYDYQYFPGWSECPPDEEMNVKFLSIDGKEISDDDSFWDTFATNEDPDRIYNFLIEKAEEVDAQNEPDYDYEPDPEEIEVMEQIRAEKESEEQNENFIMKILKECSVDESNKEAWERFDQAVSEGFTGTFKSYLQMEAIYNFAFEEGYNKGNPEFIKVK